MAGPGFAPRQHVEVVGAPPEIHPRGDGILIVEETPVGRDGRRDAGGDGFGPGHVVLTGQVEVEGPRCHSQGVHRQDPMFGGLLQQASRWRPEAPDSSPSTT